MYMVAARAVGEHPLAAIVLVVVGIALAIDVLVFALRRSELAPSPYVLSSVKDESAQVPTYLITYLFPLVFLQDLSMEDLAAGSIFVAITLVLAARTDLVLVNPFLLLIGLHLYEVETKQGRRALLLSSVHPRPGDTIMAVPFAGRGIKQIMGVGVDDGG